LPIYPKKAMETMQVDQETTINAKNLSFDFGGTSSMILKDMTFELPSHSFTLLLGANGAGKSTILRILAGKHMIKHGEVKVLNERAFFDSSAGGRVFGLLNILVTYLGTEWIKRDTISQDVPGIYKDWLMDYSYETVKDPWCREKPGTMP
jgi:CCR4-NOT complex subunit CAF16